MSTRLSRLIAVLVAVVAACVVWVVAVAAGVDVEAPMGSSGDIQEISIGMVILSAGLASLAGWGLLALLERFTAKARTIWITVAAIVFVLSLTGPLTAADVAASTRVVLLLMHVAVAAVLIPLLPRGAKVGKAAAAA